VVTGSCGSSARRNAQPTGTYPYPSPTVPEKKEGEKLVFEKLRSEIVVGWLAPWISLVKRWRLCIYTVAMSYKYVSEFIH
jgi:hypothetical protein